MRDYSVFDPCPREVEVRHVDRAAGYLLFVVGGAAYLQVDQGVFVPVCRAVGYMSRSPMSRELQERLRSLQYA